MARDPARIEVTLGLLRKFWMQHPDWRLGQLVVNVLRSDQDVFNVEDEDLIRSLKAAIGVEEPEEMKR